MLSTVVNRVKGTLIYQGTYTTTLLDKFIYGTVLRIHRASISLPPQVPIPAVASFSNSHSHRLCLYPSHLLRRTTHHLHRAVPSLTASPCPRYSLCPGQCQRCPPPIIPLLALKHGVAVESREAYVTCIHPLVND